LLWPVSGAPIVEGALLTDSAGRIAAVGAEAQVPRPEDAVARRYPDAVLLPGFVNAHTHLELTGLAGQIDEPDFVDWILHVRRAKEAAPPDTFGDWARAGVRDTWRHGITTVADTGTSGAVVHALSELGGAGIVYQEAIAPEPDRAAAALAGVRDAIEQLRVAAGPRVTVGVSPHAPYTVSPALYRAVATYAREAGLPLAGHLAESRAETAFVCHGMGPFADGWRRRGIPLGPAAPSPVALLARLGVLGPDFLAIHAVQTDEGDRSALAAAGCAVVVCPRSNRRHGHGAPPVAAYLAAGLRVGVGTDSVASVGALDLLADAREVRVLAGLSAEETLRLLTVDGARCVGQGGGLGTLTPGAWADLAVWRLPAPLPGPDLAAEALLLARPADLLATFVSGRPVYQAPTEGADRR
jgi:cytosine/adenosine deaminase-related metal-dependent hydrolase